MRPQSLVEAALLDQERRILQARPADIHGSGPVARLMRPPEPVQRQPRQRQSRLAEDLHPCDGCDDGVCSKRLDYCLDCRKRMVRVELHVCGWTASRSPCGPDDVDAR